MSQGRNHHCRPIGDPVSLGTPPTASSETLEDANMYLTDEHICIFSSETLEDSNIYLTDDPIYSHRRPKDSHLTPNILF